MNPSSSSKLRLNTSLDSIITGMEYWVLILGLIHWKVDSILDQYTVYTFHLVNRRTFQYCYFQVFFIIIFICLAVVYSNILWGDIITESHGQVSMESLLQPLRFTTQILVHVGMTSWRNKTSEVINQMLLPRGDWVKEQKWATVFTQAIQIAISWSIAEDCGFTLYTVMKHWLLHGLCILLVVPSLFNFSDMHTHNSVLTISIQLNIYMYMIVLYVAVSWKNISVGLWKMLHCSNSVSYTAQYLKCYLIWKIGLWVQETQMDKRKTKA